MSVSFGGLTGFDFSTLADQLIALERQPITLLEQRKETLSSRKAMLNEIASALNAVKTAAEALAKPKSLNFAKATSSQPTSLGVTADNSAAPGSYQVTVHQLATATRVTSGFATQLGISATANKNKNLNDPAANMGGGFTGGYITLNGVQVTINIDPDDPTKNQTNDTLQEVINRINSQVAGVTASYDSATDKLKLTSASSITVGSPDDTSNFLSKIGLLASPEVIDGGDRVRETTHRLGRISATTPLANTTLGTSLTGSGSFTINGVTIDYNAATDSLQEIIARINTRVTTVSASYDSTADKLVLSAKSTGSLGLTRTDVSGNFLAAMGLRDNSGESQAVVTAGQNAMITIAGINGGDPLYSTSNTVTNAIAGVTLTLKEADPTKTIDVTLERDASSLKTKVREFVTKYNEALNLIHARLTEEPLKDATSVTTRRVGLLRSDSLLSQIKVKLTQSVTGLLEGLPLDYNRAGNLGLGLDKSAISTGTLTFDETKFDALLESDFDKAYSIFFADADGDGTIDQGEGGLVPRLLTTLDQIVSTANQDFNGRSVPTGTLALRNYTYDQQTKTLDERIAALEKQLELREATLRAKFLAAERAISALSSNSSSFSSLA